MKVKELIASLQGQNPESEIYIRDAVIHIGDSIETSFYTISNISCYYPGGTPSFAVINKGYACIPKGEEDGGKVW